MPKPVQLLVEGKDDLNFCETVIRRLGRTDIEIRDYGGRDRLRRYMRGLRRIVNFRSVKVVAITRDADGLVADAVRSLCDAVRQVGLPEPVTRTGAGVDGASPEIRIHILGGDGEMPESLLHRAVAETPEAACVDAFVKCVEDTGRRLRNPHKSRAHAWIATRDHPEVSVGVAAQKNYWPLEHRALDDLRAFLRSL